MTLDTVLLDIDGTLVDSNYQHTVAWQRAFAEHGVTAPAWRVHRAIGMGGDRLVEHVAGPEVEERHGDAIRTAWKEAADQLLGEVRPLDGAVELLDALRSRGLTVALATSGKPDHTAYAMDALDARERIDHLTTSEDVDASKPDPDLLVAALEAVSGRRALMIGDSVWDGLAARRAGMTFLGMLTGGSGRDELLDAGAAVVHADPRSLLADLEAALERCS